MTPIKTTIERQGQPYVHQPIRETIAPKKEFSTPLAWAVHKLYKIKTPQWWALISMDGFSLPMPKSVITGYEKVHLNWRV